MLQVTTAGSVTFAAGDNVTIAVAQGGATAMPPSAVPPPAAEQEIAA